MNRFIVVCLSLCVFSIGARAGEKRKTAQVVGGGLGQVVKTIEEIPCRHELESILRDRGYRVLDRGDTNQPSILLMSTGTCNHTPQMRGVSHEIRCPMELKIRWAKRTTRKRFEGKSKASLNSAWSDGCREMTLYARKILGESIDMDKVQSPHKWKARKLNVTFRWKKGLSPMPLLKITNFFNKAGYKAKLLKSSPSHCSFTLDLEQSPQQFEELLRAYLGTQYKISGGLRKGSMTFKLTAR